MIRTQIYLPEDYSLRIALLARQQKKSRAVVVRQLLEIGFKNSQRKNNQNAGDVLLRIAKSATSKGPKDLSLHIDDYLYGDS